MIPNYEVGTDRRAVRGRLGDVQYQHIGNRFLRTWGQGELGRRGSGLEARSLPRLV